MNHTLVDSAGWREVGARLARGYCARLMREVVRGCEVVAAMG
jgi:hypothetical protein